MAPDAGVARRVQCRACARERALERAPGILEVADPCWCVEDHNTSTAGPRRCGARTPANVLHFSTAPLRNTSIAESLRKPGAFSRIRARAPRPL
jgi:hypothetical protein